METMGTTASSAGRWERLAAWLDDRLNPLVVKEVRQLVRSGVLDGYLYVLLLLLFMAVSFREGMAGLTQAMDGAALARMLLSILFMGMMLTMPGTLTRRLQAEVNNVSEDLFNITRLSPARITFGRWLSGVSVVALYHFATLPFLTFTFVMRGVDIVTVLASMLGLFLIICVSMMLAVVVGTLPAQKQVQSALTILAFLIYFYVGSTTLTIFHLAAINLFLSSTVEVLAMALSFLLVLACAWSVLFACGVAVVSPAASNRIFPVRVTASVVWLVTLLAAIGLDLWNGKEEVLPVWGHTALGLLTFALVLVICERPEPGYRIRTTIPRDRALATLAFPLFTGAPSGLAWVIGLAGLTTVVMSFTEQAGSLGFATLKYASTFIFCYALGYAAISLLVYENTPLKQRMPRRSMFILPIGLFLLNTLGPLMVIASNPFSTSSQSWESLMILSPIAVLTPEQVGTSQVVSLVSCLIAALVLLPIISRGYAGFRRPGEEVAEEVLVEEGES